MAIIWTCSCNQLLWAEDAASGQQLQCPVCSRLTPAPDLTRAIQALWPSATPLTQPRFTAAESAPQDVSAPIPMDNPPEITTLATAQEWAIYFPLSGPGGDKSAAPPPAALPLVEVILSAGPVDAQGPDILSDTAATLAMLSLEISNADPAAQTIAPTSIAALLPVATPAEEEEIDLSEDDVVTLPPTPKSKITFERALPPIEAGLADRSAKSLEPLSNPTVHRIVPQTPTPTPQPPKSQIMQPATSQPAPLPAEPEVVHPIRVEQVESTLVDRAQPVPAAEVHTVTADEVQPALVAEVHAVKEQDMVAPLPAATPVTDTLPDREEYITLLEDDGPAAVAEPFLEDEPILEDEEAPEPEKQKKN